MQPAPKHVIIAGYVEFLSNRLPERRAAMQLLAPDPGILSVR